MVENRVVGEIERNVKPSEPGFKKILKKGYEDMFFDELHKYEQKYTALHKPYDRACARLDYLDKMERLRLEMTRNEGFVDENDPRLKIDFTDLDNYADPSRFHKIAEFEDKVNQNHMGVIMPIQISVTEAFQCKDRKHNIAVQVPMPVWNERKEKEKLAQKKPEATKL